jgi:hypothetical protein
MSQLVQRTIQRTFSVLTFNVHGFGDAKFRDNALRVVDTLQNVRSELNDIPLDIICLNEVVTKRPSDMTHELNLEN